MNNGLIFNPIFLSAFIYFIGVITPGPSNMALMNVAMKNGRRPAIIFALGIVSGSFFWGMLAAIGFGAVLVHYSAFIVVLKAAGGLYLFWLSWAALKSSLFKKTMPTKPYYEHKSSDKLIFLKGFLIHLTNPKAILVWISIISFSAPSITQAGGAMVIVLFCGGIGLIVFCGYALLFSASYFRKLYAKLRRWIEAGTAFIFGYAGYRIITLSVNEI